MSSDLQSREEDAEAFLQAMTPQLMNSEFNAAILGQSNGVAAQKNNNATAAQSSKQDNQKTWKSLEANLKVLQNSGLPTRSVSYKAKASSSGVASSAFQIEKAQSFKAKTVNTTSTFGEKYKKVDITTVGDNTKEKAVSGIEGVLGRHSDGHFKQTIDDEKMLIKKGPAVNGGASPLRASEKKQESNKTSTIPSKPGPPAMASVKQEKTTTSGASRQKPPLEQQPMIPNGKISEPVKPNNVGTTAVSIPSKPSPPVAQIPGKPSPPADAKSVPKSPSKPTPPVEVKSSPIKSTSGTVVMSKPLDMAKQSTTSNKTPVTQTPKPPPSSNDKTAAMQIQKPAAPNSTPKIQPLKATEPSPHHKVTVPSTVVKSQPPASQVGNKPEQQPPANKTSAPQKTETAKPQPVVNATTKPVQPVVNATTKPVQPVVNGTTKPVQPVVNATTKPVQPVNQVLSAVSSKPASKPPVVTSQAAAKAEVKDVVPASTKPSTVTAQTPAKAEVPDSKVVPEPAAVTSSGNNVNSKVSSFNKNEVVNKSEPTVKADIPASANFSQSKALIEKQLEKDKEPTASKVSEPIKIQPAANFSQNKALLEKQLQTSENGEKTVVTQKATPQVKPAANFSQNRSLLEKQLNAGGTGKKTPPNEEADGPPNEAASVGNDDSEPVDPQAPPPPPPPPPPVGGGSQSSGGPPPPPGGPPPPPPPPPPVGFVVKKSCISDSPSQSNGSGAKKAALIPQDDASVAFLAELKKRTNKVKGSEGTADS